MNWDVVLQWINPTNLIFILLLAFIVLVVIAAENKPDFEWANSLKDENGKESVVRFASLGSFVVSTWVVMTLTVGGKLTDDIFLYYLATWSGSLILAKFAEAWGKKK